MLLWKPASILVRRPDVYFDPKGSAPDTATVNICPAPGVDVEAWIQQVAWAVHHEVHRAREQVREQGLGFLGAEAVMAKSFLQKAKSAGHQEPHQGCPLGQEGTS